LAEGKVISAEAGVQLDNDSKSVIDVYRVSRVSALKFKTD